MTIANKHSFDHLDLYEDIDVKNDFRMVNLNDLILSKLKSGSLLDIGCGSGLLLYKAKSIGLKVLGIEPNRKLINFSKSFFGELPIKNGKLEEINLGKAVFDNVTIIDVLECVENNQAFIEDAVKFLKKGGNLIIVIPALQFLFGNRDKNFNYYRRYSKKDIISLMKKNNFEIKTLRFWNFILMIPYLLIYKIFNLNFKDFKNRGSSNSSSVKAINKILFFWFKYVENNVNFGLGLSLICVAEKK